MFQVICRTLCALVIALLITFDVRAANYNSVVLSIDPAMGIMLNGPIITGDDARLETAIAAIKNDYPDHRFRAIAFNSGGGQVAEAIKMAQRIRSMGLVTVVPDGAVCASACAILFAAGTIKVVSPSAALGVHGAAVNGEQSDPALAATTIIAQLFGKLGAPASAIGRMVTTLPADMTWISPAEVEMFPLGFSQSISRTTFPIILSGYDGLLERQKQAGIPLSLSAWLPSRPMPDYQRTGSIFSIEAPPSRYILDPPTHTKELVNQAAGYAAGYHFGLSNPGSTCRGTTDWTRGCKGGVSTRLKPYYDSGASNHNVSVQTQLWLDGFDEQFRTKGGEGMCGNGLEPFNDGCRVGSRAWPRSER